MKKSGCKHKPKAPAKPVAKPKPYTAKPPKK